MFVIKSKDKKKDTYPSEIRDTVRTRRERMKPLILAVATMDTKGDEISFLASHIREAGGVEVLTVDVSTITEAAAGGGDGGDFVVGTRERLWSEDHHNLLPPPYRADVSRDDVLAASSNMNESDDENNDDSSNEGDENDPKKNSREEDTKRMSDALIAYCATLLRQSSTEIEDQEQSHEFGRPPSFFAGIVGIGGSCGTSIITPAMRFLPVGFPKIMVSTMASGNVAPYVGCTDITMMHSVADICGLNVITASILENAANAIVGMTNLRRRGEDRRRKNEPTATLGMTMFGVTTPCCEAVRKSLEGDGYEVVTFHATGAGGRAMEKLVSEGNDHDNDNNDENTIGQLSGILDLTTTEVADEIAGGILSAGPERMDALASSGVPTVMSLGACDMVNFGSMDTVPERYLTANRKLHVHNEHVTLMRTSSEECLRIAMFIAQKVNSFVGPIVLLIPVGGLSVIDVPDMPFHDPIADKVLFDEIERLVEERDMPLRKVICSPYAINAPEFAQEAANLFRSIASSVPLKSKSDSRMETPTAATQTSIVEGRGLGEGEEALIDLPKELYTPPQPSPLPPAAPGPRDAILRRLKSITSLNDGTPIIGAGAGTGISAKFEAEGGADLIVVYNSGKFRMGGFGSLAGLMPYGDANAIMLQMGEEILPVLRRARRHNNDEDSSNWKEVPLLAGVCGTDPLRCMDRLLTQVLEAGFSGVQNFPTVGLIDGDFRRNLEETGMGYEREIEMIATARQMGLLTTPYVFDVRDAIEMAKVGADVLVAHMGLTTKGSIGAGTSKTLDDCVSRIDAMVRAARDVNPQVIVLCHGGPIATPEDAQYVMDAVNGLDGFYGASSMERLPVEIAITEQMRKFKAITVGRGQNSDDSGSRGVGGGSVGEFV